MAAVPTKGLSYAAKGKTAVSSAGNYAKGKVSNYQAEKKKRADMYRY